MKQTLKDDQPLWLPLFLQILHILVFFSDSWDFGDFVDFFYFKKRGILGIWEMGEIWGMLGKQ